ncbi:hypothetical protein GCM10010238_44500 [Streptomyces griseoviridis]|uniref:Uncharacterized protein n=1 Tax=Streptomyces griseoviridis TaxID=45398 RepID=A0A918LHH6_STRGD|nr:hypothetical protein GCM10010238_44500 [Streptomyces niveoruber]
MGREARTAGGTASLRTGDLLESLWWHPAHERHPARTWPRHTASQAGRVVEQSSAALRPSRTRPGGTRGHGRRTGPGRAGGAAAADTEHVMRFVYRAVPLGPPRLRRRPA